MREAFGVFREKLMVLAQNMGYWHLTNREIEFNFGLLTERTNIAIPSDLL